MRLVDLLGLIALLLWFAVLFLVIKGLYHQAIICFWGVMTLVIIQYGYNNK